MDNDAKYGPFLKAISGADSVQARRFAAAKDLEIGWGWVSKVSSITGLSRRTIDKGVQELENEDELERPERLRNPGGERKKAEDKDPTLINDLEEIMIRNGLTNLATNDADSKRVADLNIWKP